MQKMHLPSLPGAQAVVLGGNVSGLTCALRLADAGMSVCLVEEGTCLYRELDRTGDYTLPQYGNDPWCARLFPEAVRASNTLAHPDRLKRHGEALCGAAGVRLLYGAQALRHQDEQLLIAHKSGLYAVHCEAVYDCRAYDGTTEYGIFHLHVMDAPSTLPDPLRPGAAGPGHAVLPVPIPVSADSRFVSYTFALEAFMAARLLPGCEKLTLARSGTACTPPEGLDLPASIECGLSCHAGLADTDDWLEAPQLKHENPLFPERSVTMALPAPAAQSAHDIVIVGGGTSGALAAFSAARQGLRVLLLEGNRMLGGTGTCGGVSIYWFGTRDGATAQVDARVDALYRMLGLPRNKCLWNENDVFLPDLKAHALLSLCLEAGVEVAFGATACAAILDEGTVRGVAYAQGGQLYTATAQIVIDTTGDADIAMFAGARHRYGGRHNALTYWGSLAQYTTPGSYRNNFSTMVHIGDPMDITRFIIAGRKRGDAMYDHGGYVALRESRHIESMRDITLESLLRMETPEDTLYQCFSNYDPKGKLTCDLVYAGLLPPNLRMNIPRGAVIPMDHEGHPISGLLVGGKAVGCSHDGLPGVRMQPDLQQQGFALGVLAALSIRQGVPAWEAQGVAEAIRDAGGQIMLPIQPYPDTIGAAVASLTHRETLEWLDMDPAQSIDTQPAVIACFLAEAEGIVPVLCDALKAEANPQRRLLLSRLLLWHGSEEGIADIAARINEMLSQSNALPPRIGPTTFGQLLPDHGLMPELVYLLNLLAWSRETPVADIFETVTDRLLVSSRDYRDLRAGIYCYIESVPYVAVRRNDKAFLPMLRRLLALPELTPGTQDDELLTERYAMLRLTLCEALARLGDSDGLTALREMQNHPTQAIALSATMAEANLNTPITRSY